MLPFTNVNLSYFPKDFISQEINASTIYTIHNHVSNSDINLMMLIHQLLSRTAENTTTKLLIKWSECTNWPIWPAVAWTHLNSIHSFKEIIFIGLLYFKIAMTDISWISFWLEHLTNSQNHQSHFQYEWVPGESRDLKDR